jgi:hypothetical protein
LIFANNIIQGNMNSWRHYIFEFLILFVAVTAGFLVDNWREKLSDQSREREYVQLLINDLKSDKGKLNAFKANLEYRNAYVDTLLAEFNLENLKVKSRELHFYAMNVAMIISISGLDPTDGAFTLLQNDGFRVIQKRSIIDSVFLYYEGVRRINNHYGELLESNHEILSTMMGIFDFKVFNQQWNPLISNKFDRSAGNPGVIQQDPKQHGIFINQLADQKRRILRTLHHVIRVSNRADRHIMFLEKELALLN